MIMRSTAPASAATQLATTVFTDNVPVAPTALAVDEDALGGVPVGDVVPTTVEVSTTEELPAMGTELPVAEAVAAVSRTRLPALAALLVARTRAELGFIPDTFGTFGMA